MCGPERCLTSPTRCLCGVQSLDSSQGEEGKGEEEAALLSEMETQKREYKLHFSQLRSLKKEIEQIQGLMEKLRVRLQQDFEAWCVQRRQGGGHAAGCALIISLPG